MISMPEGLSPTFLVTWTHALADEEEGAVNRRIDSGEKGGRATTTDYYGRETHEA